MSNGPKWIMAKRSSKIPAAFKKALCIYEAPAKSSTNGRVTIVISMTCNSSSARINWGTLKPRIYVTPTSCNR